MVEKLTVAAIDGGGCSEACTVEARDRLLVVRAAPGAAWELSNKDESSTWNSGG